MKKVTFILALATIMASCTKKPTACATADKTSAAVNENVSFTSCSKDYNTLSWGLNSGPGTATFTDDGTGSTTNVSFNVAGTYEILLVAYSKKNKKQDDTTVSIVIN